MLKQHREAFCPEPWELYEYVHYGAEADSAVEEHLDSCKACRALAEALKARESPEAIPAEVLDKIKSARPRPVEIRVRGGETWWDVVNRFLRKPAFAALAAAAAVLVVFILYPQEVSQYPIAFSSVAWESAPKPKAFSPSLPRLAFVLAVKDCRNPVNQRSLDGLYDGLAPGMDLYEKFQIVSPAMVKSTLQKAPDPIDSLERLFASLRSQLDVSLVGLVTIECSGKRYNVRAELVDTASGAIKARDEKSGVSLSELGEEIRRAVHSVLARAGG